MSDQHQKTPHRPEDNDPRKKPPDREARGDIRQKNEHVMKDDNIEITLDVNGFVEKKPDLPGDVAMRDEGVSPRNLGDDVDGPEEEPLEALIVEQDDDESVTDDFFELVPGRNDSSEEASSTTIDAGVLSQLREELAQKSEEAASHFDRLVRLQAEFENFKKRTYKEKQDFKKYCLENIILELLPNLDNLERAAKSAEEWNDVKTVVEGINLIHRTMSQALVKFGLTVIDTQGRLFNPAEHEAILTVDTTEKKNNIIIEEFQKGYRLNDRVIRPSLVTVARQVAAIDNENEDPDDQIAEAMKEITASHKLSDFRPEQTTEPESGKTSIDENNASD